MVETSKDILRTVDEGNGAVAFIREGFWYSTLITESYCNLVFVDVSCLSRKFWDSQIISELNSPEIGALYVQEGQQIRANVQ